MKKLLLGLPGQTVEVKEHQNSNLEDVPGFVGLVMCVTADCIYVENEYGYIYDCEPNYVEVLP